MAQLEPSNQIAINDRDEEATWHREEHPIACDPYQPLIFPSRWEHVAKSRFTGLTYSRPLITRVITVEIKMLENASEASDRDATDAFQSVL